MITNIILVTCIIAVLVAIYKQWQLENAKKDNAYYLTLLESEKQQTRSHLVNLQLEMEQTTRLRDELAKERQSGKIWREKADVQNTWANEVARLGEQNANLIHDNLLLVKANEELSSRVEKTKEIRRASAARVRARKKGEKK